MFAGTVNHADLVVCILVSLANEQPEDLDQQLLLTINYVCHRERVEIPWTDVAEVLSINASAAAIQQHIAKLRHRRVTQGLPVPPPNTRGGNSQSNNPTTKKNDHRVAVMGNKSSTMSKPRSNNNGDASNGDYDSSNPDAEYRPSSVSLLKKIDDKKSGAEQPSHSSNKHKHGEKKKAHQDIKEEAVASENELSTDDEDGGVPLPNSSPKVGVGAPCLQLQEHVDDHASSSSRGNSARYGKKTVPNSSKPSLIATFDYNDKFYLRLYMNALFNEENEKAYQALMRSENAIGPVNTDANPVTEDWADQMEGLEAMQYGSLQGGGVNQFPSASNTNIYRPSNSSSSFGYNGGDIGADTAANFSSRFTSNLPPYNSSVSMTQAPGEGITNSSLNSYPDNELPPHLRPFVGLPSPRIMELMESGMGNIPVPSYPNDLPGYLYPRGHF